MKYEINNEVYPVVILRKNNKNTYIRVKEDLKIYVTTNYFVTNLQIKKMLDQNYEDILKMVKKCKLKIDKQVNFYYLGEIYDIIWIPNKQVEIIQNRIYVKDEKTLNKWLQNQIKEIFFYELNLIYQKFEENIPYPKLKIRKMKTRWGVCNRKDNSITLNSELIQYDIQKLDYVIIHELCHFVHFNHSKNFWNLVCKYCKDYKEIRKKLKE